MSKRTPNPELLEARVHHEREWCHARWMERMTFRQISAAAALPVERGGLGIMLSAAGAKAMVTAYRENAGDVTMSRDERRERMSDEIDMRVRAARRDLDAAYRGLAEAEAIVIKPPKIHKDMEPDEVAILKSTHAAQLAGKAKLIEAWQSTIERADRRLDAAQQREEKLHGLDAPIEAKVEVTHRDAVLDELNASLVAMGEQPIEVEA